MTNQNDLLIAIRQITRAIDLNSKRLQKLIGLTSSQLVVLQALETDGSAKPSDIARRVHLSQATVTTIVDRLQKAKLVDRRKSDEDRRSVEIVLTQKGIDHLAKSPTLLQEGFIKQFETMEVWEQTLLVSSLQRLAYMMNAEGIDAAPILELGDLTDDA